MAFGGDTYFVLAKSAVMHDIEFTMLLKKQGRSPYDDDGLNFIFFCV